MRKDFSRALLAGLLGWVAFTAVLFMAPRMGLPPMNVPRMLGGMFGINSLAMGWALHLMVGLGLGVIYAYGFSERLPGAAWLRGMLFGLVPWLFMMVVLAPMLPAVDPMLARMPPGFFFVNMGLMAVMGSLIAHLIFGLVIGAVYGGETVAANGEARAA